jgi:hypothetical protein
MIENYREENIFTASDNKDYVIIAFIFAPTAVRF